MNYSNYYSQQLMFPPPVATPLRQLLQPKPPPLIKIRLKFKHLEEPSSPSSVRADLGEDTDSEADDVEEAREIDDVENWLMGEEIDLPLTTPAPSPLKYTYVPTPQSSTHPFSIFNSPAPFFLQIIHSILVYFNLLSQHVEIEKPTPSIRREMVSLPPPIDPLETDLYWNGEPDPSVKYGWNMAGRSRAYLGEDTEYVVHTADGEIIRIPVTRDISHTKLSRHGKGMLRIYRIPDRDFHHFGSASRGFGLKGLGIRLPFDEFDNVALMRHGHHSWDFGAKDDHWIVMGTDAQAIRDFIQRTRKWAPPPETRVRNHITKFIRRLQGYRSTPIYYVGTRYDRNLDPRYKMTLYLRIWWRMAILIRRFMPGNWERWDWDWESYRYDDE